MTTEQYCWWQTGIIYEIYPRSFVDNDQDGVGDLPGITSRLDYLRWLGVDAIWIAPIYASPMADFGYDVSDHKAIHPLFGTREDFDTLVEAAHQRKLKIILDYVPNHTSDQHPWFIESRASRASRKRNWYIWRDPAPGGGPPNNWVSAFGGGAWEWDAASGQYYYHTYLVQQPDLNWRNPEVQTAMLDVMRFWLDRGVDGFRVDALRQLIKDEQFRDNPPNPAYLPGQSPYHQYLPVYTADRPEVHEMIAKMRQVLDEYQDRVLIGELYLPIKRLVTYYGESGMGCHLPFNFHLILTRWNARSIATLIETYEAALPAHGWPNWVIGNHDNHRIASRVGAAQARVAAMLLLTLRGTPTLYYGDEIGMHDVIIPPERVQDPFEKNVPGRGLGRDPGRTPMQWDCSPNAGFTTGIPWLPIAQDYQTTNVVAEQLDGYSILSLYHRLIALRCAEPALTTGPYVPVATEGDVLAYLRTGQAQSFLVVLNLGHQPQHVAIPALGAHGRVVLSTHLDREGDTTHGTIDLRGDEGVVVALRDFSL